MDGILSQVLDATKPETSTALTPVATPRYITADFSTVTHAGHGQLDGTISDQWASRPQDERYTSMPELGTVLADVKGNTEHVTLKLRDIMPTIDNGQIKFKIPSQSKLIVPTNHAIEQLSVKDMMGLPRGWLARCPADLKLANLEHARSLVMSSEREVKLNIQHRDGTDDLVRAVTGKDYGYIPDFDVWQAVNEVLGGRFTVPVAFQYAQADFNPVVAANPTKEQTTLYYGDKNMCLFFVDHTTVIEVHGRKLQRGFYVMNSEVCDSSLKVVTMLLDFVCMNRNIWGQQAKEVYIRRHTKYAMEDFINKVKPALASFADGSTVGVKSAIEAAMAVKVADQKRQLELVTRFTCGLASGEDVLKAIIDEEGHEAENVWDLVLGATAVARRIPNADDRLVLEQAVGNFMQKSFC